MAQTALPRMIPLVRRRMQANRSMPRSTVIPELAYLDVTEAANWLCVAFKVHLRIGNQRAKLTLRMAPRR